MESYRHAPTCRHGMNRIFVLVYFCKERWCLLWHKCCTYVVLERDWKEKVLAYFEFEWSRTVSRWHKAFLSSPSFLVRQINSLGYFQEIHIFITFLVLSLPFVPSDKPAESSQLTFFCMVHYITFHSSLALRFYRSGKFFAVFKTARSRPYYEPDESSPRHPLLFL